MWCEKFNWHDKHFFFSSEIIQSSQLNFVDNLFLILKFALFFFLLFFKSDTFFLLNFTRNNSWDCCWKVLNRFLQLHLTVVFFAGQCSTLILKFATCSESGFQKAHFFKENFIFFLHCFEWNVYWLCSCFCNEISR